MTQNNLRIVVGFGVRSNLIQRERERDKDNFLLIIYRFAVHQTRYTCGMIISNR